MEYSVNLSLIVPAYNERENLPVLVSESAAVLARYPGEHELIVIDDGSTDGSREVLADLAERHPVLRTIHHEPGQNIGCHPSELVGLKAARGDIAVFLPADLQIRPDVVPAFVDAARGADIVASHRVQRADAAWRRWLSAANNKLERLIMGVDVHDAHSSMAFSRRAMDTLLDDVVSDSAVIPAELLVRARRASLKITEIPIPHFPRAAGRQTGAKPSEVLAVQLDLARLRWQLRS